MAIKQIHEFNITSYSNVPNASAANVLINVELKYSTEAQPDTVQVATRNANFITDVWNHMAADADGRTILRGVVQELTRMRALVAAGEATYEDFT